MYTHIYIYIVIQLTFRFDSNILKQYIIKYYVNSFVSSIDNIQPKNHEMFKY